MRSFSAKSSVSAQGETFISEKSQPPLSARPSLFATVKEQGKIQGRTLVFGVIGGSLFAFLSLPLAWMLGAMVANTLASMLGSSVAIANIFRAFMVAILGIMLGSAFDPGLLDRVGDWWITLIGMVFYLLLAGSMAYVYGRIVGKMDKCTAYFSGMPGGLSEMVIVGRQMGGNEQVISLMHGARILMVVMTLPLILQIFMAWGGGDVLPSTGPSPGARGDQIPSESPASLPLWDVVLLCSCFLGWPVARFLRIPAAMLIGPMAFSAAFHLLGWTDGHPPAWLIIVAQLVVGSAIGCRFSGIKRREIFHSLKLAAGLTVILLSLTCLIAWPLGLWSGLGWTACVLALAPGGLAEMSLIALSLDIDPAFVSYHHIVRILLVVTMVPIVYRFWVR